jgi:hypothetical protein
VGFGASLIPVELRGAVRLILAKTPASLAGLKTGALPLSKAETFFVGIVAASFSISEKNAPHINAEAVF